MSPQFRNQNANWPRASGCASAKRPPGREQGPAARWMKIPVPAPTSDLAGCGSPIRGRLRSTSRPSGATATQDEYSAAATARAAGHKAGLRSPPSPGAGLARTHPLTTLGWRCGGVGERGAVQAAPCAELSSLRTPPHARPRRGRPPRAPGRCSRAPHKVTVCSDGGARTPAMPELLARRRPEPPLRPWPPATAGRRSARSDGGDPSRPAGEGEGTMAARSPNKGHMSPRAAIVRLGNGPPNPAPSRPAIGCWA